MTDRVNALTVLLDRDIRDDDIEPLLTAIRMLRGVMKVETHVANFEQVIALERARRELRETIHEILYPRPR